MSKYAPLWHYIKQSNQDQLLLSFAQIKEIVSFSIDHSFLTYKKELFDYGHQVVKISLKAQTVLFEKIKKSRFVVHPKK